MRQIKFRAKVLFPNNKLIIITERALEDGDWVYGELHVKSKIPHIHTGLASKFPIDPKTVGQFTGLLDKNGKEIYEGDIVSIEAIKSRVNKVVEWNSERACWDAGGENRIELYAFCYCEVIGNIYDNPELLNESDHD